LTLPIWARDPRGDARIAGVAMAQTQSGIRFGSYRLDIAGARLWKGDDPVALQPRPLAVLSYLAARPGAVVGRDQLIAALWGGTHVTKAVLKVAVRAIREALDDDADAPRYLETVGREGYRFIGTGPTAVSGTAPAAAPPPGVALIGRESGLAALHAGLARALDGTRTVVFVTGEAGIGKTTLVDRFVDEVGRAGGVRVARGQCLEHYGEGEAYLPMLEALGGLAHGEGARELAEALGRQAPTWIAQLPALVPPGPSRSRPEDAVSTMPARMLRELADALEVFTRRRALVLVLEDLHWCDRSSVDLLSCLARRREPARLLVIGSLRPAEPTAHDHALRTVLNELRVKALCEEITLEPLSPDEVAAYVDARFAGAPAGPLRRLAARVYERTEGNALFMVNMVNDLDAEGLLERRDGRWHVEGSIDTATDRVPNGLQQLIGRRLHGLEAPARQVLEAASVAGDEFAVAAVAAALDDDAERIEDTCERLAVPGGLIADAGVAEWPDGSVSGRYRFRHALYRQVLYQGIAAARRARLHRAIAARQEAGFGAQASEHAAELAMHFTRGRAHTAALRFHELAAAAAIDRHAAHEAVAHYGGALAALAHTPEGDARAGRELALVVARATLLMAIHGYAAPETEQAFGHARGLCAVLPVRPQLHPVLRGLVSYHHVRAELSEARAIGEQLLRHAAQQPEDVALRVQAHYGYGATLFHTGALAEAAAHLGAALHDYDPAAHRHHIQVYGGYDPGVACSLWLAWTRALQGELEQAAAYNRDGLALAHRHGELFSLAWAYYGTGVSQQLFGDWAGSEQTSAAAMRLADEHGFPYVFAMATVHRGWALMMQGKIEAGIPMLRDGVAMVHRTGAALVRPAYLAMLAAADVAQDDRPSAIARFDEALTDIERTGERVHEPALLIGKSRLLAADGDRGASPAEAAAAETSLRRALDVAHGQGARLVELRAAVALGRHWRARGRTAEARALVADAHAWFASRPPDAPEIAAARGLLAGAG
jgi:DNA-binding winged helix-turn-helix (wHTH) protein/tetratricopeptide (TPR) repeat protein